MAITLTAMTARHCTEQKRVSRRERGDTHGRFTKLDRKQDQPTRAIMAATHTDR